MEAHRDSLGDYHAQQPEWFNSRSSLSQSGSSHSTKRPSTPTTINYEKHRASLSTVYYLTLDLPINESPVPVLWTIEHGSRWSAQLQAVSLRLRGILCDAKFHVPQFGLFTAGDDADPCRNPEVLAILLEPYEVGNWREVDEQVQRLCWSYWGDIGLPPIRYWIKAQAKRIPMVSQHPAVTASPKDQTDCLDQTPSSDFTARLGALLDENPE